MSRKAAFYFHNLALVIERPEKVHWSLERCTVGKMVEVKCQEGKSGD